MKRRRIVRLICIALATAGILLLVAGALPYERMQSFGALVRRADDFTPERFARYRHVCWFFAIVMPALAVALWRTKPQARIAADERARGPLVEHARLRRDWMLWLIVAVGFGLRLQRLFDPVAYDEAYTYLNFASRPWYEAIGDYNSTNNHLLNTLLMHVSTRIFGPQEWAMRWHVLLAGSALPIAVYVWGKEWLGRGVGLIAAAAVAVSPMLITYSTDARGYMLVALAAIVFDLSLGRLARDGADTDRRAGWLAWGALAVGLCSMPLMVYPAAGSAAWFVCTGFTDGRDRRVVVNRVRMLAGLGLLVAPVVAAFYAPAYIFRGMMFLRDPVVQPAAGSSYIVQLISAWGQAYSWWTEGLLVGWLWGPLALLGLAVMPSNTSRLRWLLPFMTVLLLNVLQHVAPPPRIYMHLAAWLFLGFAVGLLALLHASRDVALRDGFKVAALLLVLGAMFAFRTPVLFHASERADFESVPAAIQAVQQSVARQPDERHILLAPLPSDLPALFYLRRSGQELPVNERPQPGDHVYLLARPFETPQHVLATPLLGMSDIAPQFDEWLEVASFRTLTLYASQIAAPAK